MTASVAMSATGSGGAAARPRLEHAYLQLHEPSTDGSFSRPGSQLGRIDFQFNPKELNLTKAAQWSRPSGRGNRRSGPPQYNGPQPSRLTLEMFFDASEAQDDSVVRKVEQLFACCVPTDASHQQHRGSPPWILFRWGGLTGFLAYVSSVSVKYTVFTAGGLPIRATCTVTLEEISGDTPRQNPTSGTLIPQRVHQLIEGDTLHGIAFREYGDAALWRTIAHLNGVDDPMRLRPGGTLLLPPIDQLPRRGDAAGGAGDAGTH